MARCLIFRRRPLISATSLISSTRSAQRSKQHVNVSKPSDWQAIELSTLTQRLKRDRPSAVAGMVALLRKLLEGRERKKERL